MTGKEKAILAVIKTALGTVTAAKFVGEYPFDVHKIGNNYPAILVESGDERPDEDNEQNGIIAMVYDIAVHIHTQTYSSRLSNMVDLQTAIINAITSATWGTSADCAKLVNIEKGNEDDYNPFSTTGSNDNLTKRTINFEVKFRDLRW